MTSKTWNWQQDDWPNFSYDKKKLAPLENEYTKESGISIGVLRHLSKKIWMNSELKFSATKH